MSIDTHQSSWQPNVAPCHYLFCLVALSGVTGNLLSLLHSFSWWSQIKGRETNSQFNTNFLFVNTNHCPFTDTRSGPIVFPRKLKMWFNIRCTPPQEWSSPVFACLQCWWFWVSQHWRHDGGWGLGRKNQRTWAEQGEILQQCSRESAADGE